MSPYLKTLSMVAAIKLLHLLEAFSTPWFLFSAPSNHHLVFFLLEIFNNIIQYQFDGNSNLVYTIIRKRQVFHALANLPSDLHGISKCLINRKGLTQGPVQPVNNVREKAPLTKKIPANIPRSSSTILAAPVSEDTVTPTPDEDEFSNIEAKIEESMEGSHPALPAEPGTLKVSLLDTPAIGQMTERESAHPVQSPLADFSPAESEAIIRTKNTVITNEYEEESVATSSSRNVEQVCLKIVEIYGIH